MRIPAEVWSSAGLLGGYLVARKTKREFGGVVLAVGGAAAGNEWRRSVGGPAAAALGVLYTAGFGASHPLAKKVGAWPSVLIVTGAVTGASLLARRITR